MQPGIKWLITRDTGTSLSKITYEHIMSKVLEDDLIADIKMKPFPQVDIINGSKIFFIPYDEMAVSKAGGSEYGIILIEEAQRFTLSQYVYMETRLCQMWGEAIGLDGRKFKNPIKYNGLWSTANPAGRGYLWQLFRRDHPLAYLGGDPDFLGIEFTREDNKEHVSDAQTRALKSYSKSIQDRFLTTEENPMQGLCFPEFNKDINVCRMRNFIPPPHWRIIGGMDFGFQTPTVFLWMAITEGGFCVFFNEYRKALTVRSTHSKNIIAQTNKMLEKGMPNIEAAWVDPSTDMQDGKTGTTQTIFEQLRDDGLGFLYKAKKMKVMDRVIRMRDLLNPDPNKKIHPITGMKREGGWPTVIFTEDCDETVKEFEEWEFEEDNSDKRDPKERPQQKNDHGCDAAFYALNSYFGFGIPELPQTVEIIEGKPEIHVKKAVNEMLEKSMKMEGEAVTQLNESGAVY